MSYLGRPYSHTERYGRKRFGEGVNDVIVGKSRRTETIIVPIDMFKIIHEPEIGWTGRSRNVTKEYCLYLEGCYV